MSVTVNFCLASDLVESLFKSSTTKSEFNNKI